MLICVPVGARTVCAYSPVEPCRGYDGMCRRLGHDGITCLSSVGAIRRYVPTALSSPVGAMTVCADDWAMTVCAYNPSSMCSSSLAAACVSCMCPHTQ